MAYSKQTWVRGEKVASTKLNHMEDGIDAISANGAIGTANLADGAVTAAKLDESATDIIADTFSTSTEYSVGDYCIYSGALYRFTADKAAGAWDSTKVVSVALSDDVNNVNNALGSEEQTLYPLYNQTNVVLKGGTTAHYDNWYSTDFIPYNEGDTYNIGAWGYYYNNINICAISFFNSNKEYIGAVSGEDIGGAAGNRYYVGTPNFPNGTAYFKQTLFSGGGSDNFTIKSSLNNVKELKEKVDTIYDGNMGYVPIAVSAELTSVVLYGGGTGTFSNWYSSDFLPCENSEKIKVVAWCYFRNGIDICPLSFYDEGENYIYGISGELGVEVAGANRLYQGEVVIPKNAKYFKLTAFKGSESSGYSQASAELYQYVIKDYIESLNIVCIGDSLTEGDLGADPYASRQNITPYNYPYWMQKYLLCAVENKGKSGYTTMQAWNNVVQNIDFTDVNTVIIMLGSNGGLTDTIETDCPENTSYTDYANTNTGCYCKIIEYCMAQTNGTAQIILCTPPHVGKIRGSKRTTTIAAAEVVRKIALRYSIPLIDMMLESGFSDYNESVYQPVDGLHFTVTGYRRMGTFIGSRVQANNAVQIDAN